MKRILLLVTAFGFLLLPGSAGANVAVEILDATPSVYSFEPVWVTFEVRNEGGTPLLIPADGCSGQGAFLEVGWHGQSLSDPFPVYDCRPDRAVWLAPGDRWLFLQHAAPGAEGIFEVAAVLRSPGECSAAIVGPTPAPERLGAIDSFECWEGEAKSQRISIEVVVPLSKVDQAAANALGLRDIRSPRSLFYNVKALLERFPTSHYTYAALRAAGSDLSMFNAILLQPDNPLNPWAAGALAAHLAYNDRPCAVPKRPRRGAPPDLAERYERVIAAYPPPEPVSDYLRQLELEYAAEECPEREAEEEQRDE